MNTSALQPKQETMEKLNAFSLYLIKGIEVVKNMFPEHVSFVKEHKGMTIEEVRNELFQSQQEQVK